MACAVDVDIDDDIVRVHQLKSINHLTMIIPFLCAQIVGSAASTKSTKCSFALRSLLSLPP